MRVVLYHNYVAPYRHALFRELAQRQDLEIWYSTLRTRERSWSVTIPDSYTHHVLSSIVLYRYGRPLIFCSDLVRRLRRSDADVVVPVLTRSNAFDVLRLVECCRRRSVPVVPLIGAVEADAFRDEVPRPVERLFEWYYRRVLRTAAGSICYSRRSEAWARARGARPPFVHGTQVLEASEHQARTAVPGSERPVTGLFVGRLDDRKGFDLLLQALGRLAPDLLGRFRLQVAGQGPLAERASTSGLPVELLGSCSREALWKTYRDADFLVLSSRHDPWGFVTNEAMSMGTPALVSCHAGSEELAVRGGWVFDPCEDVSFDRALSQAIRECRSASIRRRALAAESEYRPGPCAARLAEFLRGVAVKPRRRQRVAS